MMKKHILNILGILGMAAVFAVCSPASRSFAAENISTPEQLDAAFNTGGSYVLTTDIQYGADFQGWTLAGKTLELDLNGCDINIYSAEELWNNPYIDLGILTIDGGKLTLIDSAEKSTIRYNCYNIFIKEQNGASLIFDGVTVNTEYVLSADDSYVEFNSGGIASYMGMSLNNGSTMEMNGGTIGSGYGISCSSDSAITINGGDLISYGKAWIETKGTTDIFGGSFTLNKYAQFSYDDFSFIDVKGGKTSISGGRFNCKCSPDNYKDNSTLSLIKTEGEGALDISGGCFIWEDSLIDNRNNNKITMTGGYYAGDPSEWVSAGYEAVECTDAGYEDYSHTVKAVKKQEEQPQPAKVKPIALLKGAPSGKSAVKLSWKKVDGAAKYVIYGNQCTKKGLKKIRSVDAGKTSLKIKKIGRKRLKAHNTYRFYIAALDKNGKVIAKSLTAHVITGKTMRGNYSNAVKITAARKSLSLKAGQKTKISASLKIYKNKKPLGKGHGPKLRFVTDDPKVAKVDSKGRITGLKKGTCKIYIQAVNGLWCTTTVVVH